MDPARVENDVLGSCETAAYLPFEIGNTNINKPFRVSAVELNSSTGAESGNFETKSPETDVLKNLDFDMHISEDKSNLGSHRDEILDFLAKSRKAHFKSQQRDEPDLSYDEKRQIAENLFLKSLPGFLSRFGNLLSKKYLDYFHTFQYSSDSEKEEVEYVLSYLGASQDKSTKTRLKNRRYDALQKMVQNGSYFSMEEMQARNPLLYEQLVGRYLNDDEKQTQKDEPPMDSDFPLMQYFAKRVEKERIEKFKEQQEMDEASDGEDDSSDEAEKNPQKPDGLQCSSILWGEYMGKFQSEISQKSQQKKKSKRKNIPKHFEDASEEEKAFYRHEFQAAMYHSFLSGNDKDFDYSSVDNNSEYDCVDMRERDEQDRYFDDESPGAVSYADLDCADSQGLADPTTRAIAIAEENPEPASPMRIDENEDDDSIIHASLNERLTHDDVENLKSFASSWANSHSQIKSDSSFQENQLNSSTINKKNVTENTPLPSLHKVPVKKNHKIKIHLTTKEI